MDDVIKSIVERTFTGETFFDAHGENHPLSLELQRVLLRDFLLSNCVYLIYHEYELPEGRVDVRDSLMFASGGVELLHSAIFMTLSQYQPAPYYLLRSALNQLWFSYSAITNLQYGADRRRYDGQRFYDVYRAERPFMSTVEIRAAELERLTGNTLPQQTLVGLLNSFVHSDQSTLALWFRNNLSYPGSPSPERLDAEALQEVVLPLFAHLRGMQEVARVLLKAVFVDFEPDNFWTLYDNVSFIDEGESAAALQDEMNALIESGNADLSRLHQAPGVPAD